MSDRNLTTTRTQVFGDVECGTECRVCGRNVEDGRAKTCSDYCSNILTAVMGLVNWTTVRRHVIDRDEETCQRCGFDKSRERLARDHISDIIDEKLDDRPEYPSMADPDVMEDFDWDRYYERREAWAEQRDALKERYGDPHRIPGTLEVDHITPIAEGGHPFDPANLQTLCDECHQEKTARENSERAERETPSRGELSKSLFEYCSGDQEVRPGGMVADE